MAISNRDKYVDSTYCSQRDEDEAKQLIAIYGLAPSDKARINIPPAVINQRKKSQKSSPSPIWNFSSAKSSPIQGVFPFLVLYSLG